MPADPPDDPKRRPPDNRGRRVEISAWAGPIPPPDDLRAIDEIVFGAAERIVRLLETETDHRRRLEARSQMLPFWDQLFGRVSAFLFAAGCLLLIWYAIDKGAQWAAGFLSAAMVVAGINAFLRRR